MNISILHSKATDEAGSTTIRPRWAFNLPTGKEQTLV